MVLPRGALAGCGFLLLSLLLTIGLVECQYGSNAHNQGSQSYASVNPTGGYKHEPNPHATCRESTDNYDCIFHNVFIEGDPSGFTFGHEGQGRNNQTKLTFKNSILRTLPRSLLDSFRNVEVLNLESVQLNSIEQHALANGHHIRQLFLSFNDITSLDVGVFDNLLALEYLIMDRNNLSSFPSRLFKRTTALRVLSLANNHLQRIEDNTFAQNGQLEKVVVSSNRLTHFDLSRIRNLTEADVSFNVLQKLSLPHAIESIDASNNNIVEVVGQSPRLSECVLSHNKIHNTAWVRNFPNIVTLNLSHNALEDITSEDFKALKYLERLKLNNNRLFTFDFHTKGSIGSLKFLDLSHNGLLYVERNQAQFEVLEELLLDHNSIVALKLSGRSRIRNLTLAHNELDCAKLGELFKSAPNTHVIDANTETGCAEEYIKQHGICCKSHPMPYLDRLIKYITKESANEKAARASGRCSGDTLKIAVQNLTDDITRSGGVQSNQPTLLGEVDQLRYSVQQVRQQIAKFNVEKELDHVDKLLIENRIPKQGLVPPSVNLKSVFDHLQQREEFKANETVSRIDQAEHKKGEMNTLSLTNIDLHAIIANKKKQTSTLKANAAAVEKRVKQTERFLNRNAPAQRNTK